MKKCGQRFISFILIFFLRLCRFFQLRNGLHNNSRKKSHRIKRSLFYSWERKKKLRLRCNIELQLIIQLLFLVPTTWQKDNSSFQSNADVLLVVILSIEGKYELNFTKEFSLFAFFLWKRYKIIQVFLKLKFDRFCILSY